MAQVSQGDWLRLQIDAGMLRNARVVVHNLHVILVEASSQMLFSSSQAHSVGNSLAQWTYERQSAYRRVTGNKHRKQ